MCVLGGSGVAGFVVSKKTALAVFSLCYFLSKPLLLKNADSFFPYILSRLKEKIRIYKSLPELDDKLIPTTVFEEKAYNPFLNPSKYQRILGSNS